MRARPFLVVVLGLGLTGVFSSCGPTDFDPPSLINTVRILATRSDQPYAKPGATVHTEVLAVDGRPDGGGAGATPMQVFWLPLVCINPPNDAYYGCFQGLVDGGVVFDGGAPATLSPVISKWDGGADAAVGARGGGGMGGGGGKGGLNIPMGVNLNPLLISGTKVAFSLPSDIVSTHTHQRSETIRYGLAILFNIACAGQVEAVPLDPSNPVQVPVGCFDSSGNLLSPSDWVIGYTEVFAFESLTASNPVISSYSFDDAGVPIEAGADAEVTVPHCTTTDQNACPKYGVGVEIPDASWQPDPLDSVDGGQMLHTQIWVDYFTTTGQVSDDALLFFDPSVGRITPPPVSYLQAAQSPQNGRIWAVAHDNRGGASWVSVGVVAQ